MSEQKMDNAVETGPANPGYAQSFIDAIYATGFEAGRQQERERLEPLRVAVEALKFCIARQQAAYGDEQDADFGITAAEQAVVESARTLLEQTE